MESIETPKEKLNSLSSLLSGLGMAFRKKTIPLLFWATIGMVFLLDASHPLSDSISGKAYVAIVQAYQGNRPAINGKVVFQCRFTQSCSRYSVEAVSRHGLLFGGYLTVKRIFRCNAWTPAGTIDPVPEHFHY